MDIKKFRRVVTGVDTNGKAIVVSDEHANNILHRETRPGVALTNLWQIGIEKQSFSGFQDTVSGPFVLHPPKRGSVFRVIQFDPEDKEFIKNVDGKKAFAAMGASSNIVANARHPYMHKTESVDYSIVLKGSITMLLDGDDVELKEGDVVIQRGTNHAWSNRGTESCFMLFVLNDMSY